jgi:hypothetical protein
MAAAIRIERMAVRLTEEEAKIRDALARRLGIDASGVMRMALLRLAQAEGITLKKEKPDAK